MTKLTVHSNMCSLGETQTNVNGVAKDPRNILQELLQHEDNLRCADCNDLSPTWASTNWGVFICTQCAGVHRLAHVTVCVTCGAD